MLLAAAASPPPPMPLCWGGIFQLFPQRVHCTYQWVCVLLFFPSNSSSAMPNVLFSRFSYTQKKNMNQVVRLLCAFLLFQNQCVPEEHTIFAWATVCNWFRFDLWKMQTLRCFLVLRHIHNLCLALRCMLSFNNITLNGTYKFVCERVVLEKPKPLQLKFNWFQLQKICMHSSMKYIAWIHIWND